MVTKIRRGYENYLDNYWETTFEHTGIHNEKFRGTLKLVRDFINQNKQELNRSNITKKEFAKINKKIQILVRINFPTKQQKERTITIQEFTKKIDNKDKTSEDELISPRKIINGFVKLGFTQPGLTSYHPDADIFLNARTNRKRRSIFSKIVYEGSNFRSSTTKDNPSGHLEFLIKTLEEVQKLCDDDIKGLMITDIKNYPIGYLTENELQERIDFSKQINPVDGSRFATDRILSKKEVKVAKEQGWKTITDDQGNIIIKSRKYNQLHFLKTLVLKNLDDVTFKEGCLYFEEDAKKLFIETPTGRDNYLHGIYRNILRGETIEKLNEPQCMVEGTFYPTLIASHIKRWEVCNKEYVANTNDVKTHEGYDANNGLYLSGTLDDLFDKGWITFDDDGKIIFATNLPPKTQIKLKDSKINPIFLNPKRKEYLKWNRENWFKKEKSL